jgi:hypothetical protein
MLVNDGVHDPARGLARLVEAPRNRGSVRARQISMPLLVIILALLIPRITIALLYLFTNWFQGMFAHVIWPILGFIFLPTTLLWYSVVHIWFHGEWGVIPVAGIVIALIIDLFPARRRRAMRTA